MRSTRRFLPVLILLGIVGAIAFADAAPRPLRIVRINPSGNDVPAARQIVFQFDRAVVPVGRMERDAFEIPIEIDPDPGCEWRWINTSALACQLGEENELAASTRYRIVVQPGLTSEDGATLAGPVEHSFVTQRPKVVNTWFETWRSPGTPHVRVTFDQRVRRESAERHLFFQPAGGDPVPLTLARFRESETTWTAVPAFELPLGRQVALSVEPGIESTGGNEPGVERREIVVFRTFNEHRFLGVECVDIRGKRLRLNADELQPPGVGCDPLGGVSLVFSSPVIKEILRDHLVVDPDLAGGREDYDPWERVGSYSRLSGASRDHRYHVQLPEVLEAHREYRITADAEQLRDEFDRALAHALDFRFRTSHRRPRLHLGHTASVLESRVETHLPVVVTNLDAIRVDLRRFTADGLGEPEQQRIDTPEEPDVAYRFPLRVREWLDGRSGAVVGEVRGEPATREKAQWFFSQVTPFHVHVKLGHYNTLVWVSDLATGSPVEGARVDVIERRFQNLGEASAWVQPPGVMTDAAGLAGLPGSAVLDPELKKVRYWKNRNDPHLFVCVQKGDELALVPLAREFEVDTRRFVPEARRRRHGHLRTWGATAQGIYRAGDTVQYKIYVRNEGNQTLEPAPPGDYRLRVVDPMGKQVLERKEIRLNEFGAFDGEFKVPETGAVGWYRFELQPSFTNKRSWQPLRVLVSDFTPAPFRVTTDLNAELFRDGEPVEVSSKAALHAGGPYVEAQTRITAVLRPEPFRPEGSLAKEFWFQTAHAEQEMVHQSDGLLDDRGLLETRFLARASNIVYGTLTVETAVRDDRGKNVAGRSTARFATRDRFVGIRQDDWVLEAGQPAEVHALVTDERGEVTPGVSVFFAVERRVTQASRVKGAGNAYLTQYIHSWKPDGECTKISGDEPVTCEFTPSGAGSYRLTVAIEDSGSRGVQSRIHRWATGPGVVLWEEPPGHSLEILPENESLKVGQTARYLVKNPFPGATALITIERYGVIESWTQTLEGSTPIVSFPVKPEFLPGFYLSVVVMSPRVERPSGEGHVDLGKPAFRAGYVRVPVRDPYKELEVLVEPAAEVYKPRETVEIEIAARPRQGEDRPPLELAVAVLDEAVLDLLSRGTELFDPYEGFYGLHALDVANYNLLTRLIGVQRFEKKGADPGGGGGMEPSVRSLFKFVSYWNPSVRPDAQGRARVEFEVPDNLTAWRVLVMAVTPGDRMGLGQGSFRVNLPTEIRPALPNRVIEGDRFEARFTVMNRTDEPRTLVVTGSAAGQVEPGPGLEETIEAEPYKRYVVGLSVETTGHGEVRMEVRAGDERDADGLAVRVPVGRRKALEAAATYGTTTRPWVVESLRFPEGIRDDVGRVSVTASPTVLGGVDGAFRYLRDYAYICWEQKLTKGVMAAFYTRLRAYVAEDLEWPEAETLPRTTLALATNHQAPNGGMTYFVPRDEYVSPYLSAYTALAFEWMRELGHEIPPAVEKDLHGYLLKLLRKDVFPSFYSKGMASSVRAVALAALARSGKITAEDLLRYRGHVPQMDLFGKAHYLHAVQHVDGAEPLGAEVQEAILALAGESGGKIVFAEQLDDGYARMLHSDVRSSCAVLSSLVLQGEARLAQSGAQDLPFKLVRTITQRRKQRDRWENTQENMFCMSALVDYTDAYEQVQPRFDVLVHMDGKLMGARRFRSFREEAAEFERPIREGDPGRRGEVRIKRKGEGRVYYGVRMFYSPAELKTSRINSGIEVRREYSVERHGRWIRLEDPAVVRRGELVRVDLYVSLPVARTFVVVDDPVPGGLEPVNRDLATASTVDADKARMEFPPDAFFLRYDDWRSYAWSRWSFYHRELRHDSARFYSEYLPAGRYHLSYVAQVIAPGEFTMLPVHVEEMYDPDVFGQGLPGTLTVEGEAP